MSLVSVVIPARNAAGTLPFQLEALRRQDHDGDWEVVVADDGSTDGTGAVAAAFGASLPVRVVDTGPRRGPAAARNAGARAAAGTRLLFTDADDVAAPGWLHGLARSSHLFATGPIPRFRGRGRPPDGLLGLASRPPTLLGYLPYAPGANLAIDAACFAALGGFDESLRVGEDVDLSWRAQLAGQELAFVADAIVHKRDDDRAWQELRRHYHYGRADAVLYRRYRDRGAPGPDAGAAARAYAAIGARVAVACRPGAGRSDERRRLVQQLGRRAGRLAGSLGCRVWYP